MCDTAFLAGSTSTLHATHGCDVEDIVETLRLADPISDALLYRKGRIGAALSLCEAIETGDAELASTLTHLFPAGQAWTG